MYLPELLRVLEKERKYCENAYIELGYSEEISFGEFFIWWYHFIYTQATDLMNTNKILQVPEDGNLPYRIKY